MGVRSLTSEPGRFTHGKEAS